MVGESKKRSKTSSTSSSSAVPQSPKLSKEEVFNVSGVLLCSNCFNFLAFQNAIAFEEKEEMKFNRDAFKTCFTELSKLMQEVAELKLKSKGDEEVS